MIVQNQGGTIVFLKQSSTYGISAPIEVIETHISLVFLAGDRAFKLKRAVKLPYLDFSAPALRVEACQKEVTLNSRTAPGIYVGVRRITRANDGELSFDGSGELADAVVEMVRFDQACLLDQMAASGKLQLSIIDDLTRAIADFHRSAAVIHERTGSAIMRAVLEINEAALQSTHVLDPRAVATLNRTLRNELNRHADLLDRREVSGKVRHCHGDLHLRNICLIDGVPRLFDCIEFNDAIAIIDTLYDLSFLLMDLWHRGLPDFANAVINRYLDRMDDGDGLCLLPFFMSLRAAIRAHVIATQAEDNGSRSEQLIAAARSYLTLAGTLLKRGSPCLVAIGGLSGSGKTTVAELLAFRIGAAPGARIIESDRIRKAMYGVSPKTRLSLEAYRPDISAQVYDQLTAKARKALEEGGTVIVDAVFARPNDRLAVEEMARQIPVRFIGIWLDADALILQLRVQQRVGGASDATIEVLNRQLQQDLGTITWLRLDAADSSALVVQQIEGAVNKA